MSIDSFSTDLSVDSSNDDGDNTTEDQNDELWNDLLETISVDVVDANEVMAAQHHRLDELVLNTCPRCGVSF